MLSHERRDGIMGALSDKNKKIIEMFNKKIADVGLKGKLAMEPVANTFTYRPRYFKYADGIPRFKVHLWDLNKLPDEKLENEITNRINQARKHFNV